MERPNKLCNAFVLNTNSKSVIRGFEIVTCREMNDYIGGSIIQEIKTADDFLDTYVFAYDDPFYRIFAVYKKDYFRARRAIADFYHIKEAMTLLEEITGNPVHIYSY